MSPSISEPINIVLLGMVIVTYGGAACLWYSSEALERLGRKFRARSRGLIASKAAFGAEYRRSLDEDARSAEGRRMLVELETERAEE